MASSRGISETAKPSFSNLAITYRNIEELHADLKNPRRHSKRQTQQIALSIKAFGFNVPFLVDRDLRLIAGHGRLSACKFLNIQRVPTICLEHLTEDQARAFMIADNRLTEIGTWDDQLLAEEFKNLSELNLDFSLEATGFEVGEIDVMLEGLAGDSGDGENTAEQIPELDETRRVSEPGDLWALGANRLICADALDEQTYRTLMHGGQAAAVFIDPPYNDPIDGYVTGFGKVHHAEFKMASGEMTGTEYTQFLSKGLKNLVDASVSGSLHFVCMDWRHIGELQLASQSIYSELKNVCVWVKDSGGQGSLYRSQHELVFVFKNGTSKHRNNIQLGQFGRYRTNVWQYPRVNSKVGKEQTGSLTRLHPTVKPVAMVADAIMDCTAHGDIILDAFAGSGTTLIAAERVGRIAYAIELDPFYVDLAIRRWQEYTGKTAIHERSGSSFAQVQESKYERR
jgi:DNA modification methylase